MVQPEAVFDNAKQLTKKTASLGFWGKFQAPALRPPANPSFGRNMGERYLSSGSLAGGAMLWGLLPPSLPDAAGIALRRIPALLSRRTSIGLGMLFSIGRFNLLVGGVLGVFHISLAAKVLR